MDCADYFVRIASYLRNPQISKISDPFFFISTQSLTPFYSAAKIR
jgi:hypothetical protein